MAAIYFSGSQALLGNPLALEALLRSKPGVLKSGSPVAKQELDVQVRPQAGAWERARSDIKAGTARPDSHPLKHRAAQDAGGFKDQQHQEQGEGHEVPVG